jgi:predicted nucleic acid-binding protein
LIAALLVPGRTMDTIVQACQNRAFTLLTCDHHIDELRACFTRPWLEPERIRRHEAGRLINTIRHFAVLAGPLPDVTLSPDPDDDFLLALSEIGNADYLVSGDKADLLMLGMHRGTRIIVARDFAMLI